MRARCFNSLPMEGDLLARVCVRVCFAQCVCASRPCTRAKFGIRTSLLANHLEMVRRIDLLQGSTAVMSFESNLAFESQHLLHHLQTTGFSRWFRWPRARTMPSAG